MGRVFVATETLSQLKVEPHGAPGPSAQLGLVRRSVPPTATHLTAATCCCAAGSTGRNANACSAFSRHVSSHVDVSPPSVSDWSGGFPLLGSTALGELKEKKKAAMGLGEMVVNGYPKRGDSTLDLPPLSVRVNKWNVSSK